MMQGDDIPLATARTDNFVSAERGEANNTNIHVDTGLRDHAGLINVQKEIIVT